MGFLAGIFGSNEFQNIDVQGYQNEFLDQNVDHALVDVRTLGEFDGGHLPGALNIPLNELAHRIHEIPEDKPVILVCATGNRSQTAANALIRAKFDKNQVYNLVGGTMNWMMMGNPLEQ